MATEREQQSMDTLLECPITGTRFIDPVIGDDGHTYERTAIVQWLQQNTTSPMTRQPMSINSLHINYLIKQILEIEKKAERQNYRFKLNVDVKKKRNQPFFQNGDKYIYEAEWINNVQGPEIIVLNIRGARASKEASFYVKLSRHPNIVRTFGMVEVANEQDISIMLLQEYAPLGDLAELLHNEPILPNNVYIFYEIFLQIIDAMTYLAQKNIVHGDLACRNIIVFNFHHTDPQKILVKLTDFGLTRASTIYQRTNYVTSTINIFPLRSSAPEILQPPNDQRLYTEKSDMYSMGVLMWECLSKGVFPWIDESEDEIRRKVLNGERLQRPRSDVCSDELWNIILQCMAHHPDNRPNFVQLDRLISNLYPNRAPIYVRYAQYISVQHQQGADAANSNNPLPATAIPAAVVTTTPRQQTVSEEKLVHVTGAIIIDDDGRTAGYRDNRCDLFVLGGSNSYSSGIHRIRLKVIAWQEYGFIQFFGIISESVRNQTYTGFSVKMPSAYGWSTHNVYEKGKVVLPAMGTRIRCGNTIELIMDCTNHKISFSIYHKGNKSPAQNLLIDTQACPFPWKWRLEDSCKTWCLQLV